MNSEDKDRFYLQAKKLAPAQYTEFKRAVETGKWADGAVVSVAQRETMLQAIIIYEHENNPMQSKTGELDDNCEQKARLEINGLDSATTSKTGDSRRAHIIASERQH